MQSQQTEPGTKNETVHLIFRIWLFKEKQIKADFAGNNKKIRSAPRGEVWVFYFVKIELAFKVPVFGSEVLD